MIKSLVKEKKEIEYFKVHVEHLQLIESQFSLLILFPLVYLSNINDAVFYFKLMWMMLSLSQQK